MRPYYWFGAWSLGGAIIAMLGTPRWQTPWYRRQTEVTVNKSVNVTTTGAERERHEYSSMEEVPPEIRSEVETLEKEGMRGKANELSVVESSQSGNAITTKIVRRGERFCLQNF